MGLDRTSDRTAHIKRDCEMFMLFSRIVSRMLKKEDGCSPVLTQKNQTVASKNDEVELLMLKYEKLQYIQEKEKERNKTVENKASMFIGSTSIMGAIIIGCVNLVLNGNKTYSYVNMCILLFMLILIYCLGRSITYSVLTLRKRKFWYLGIDDLQNTTNKKEYYTKLIDSTIKIIKHNQTVINNKVDLMQIAQESFVSFWIWSGVFFVNLLLYQLFHAYDIGLSRHTMIMVLMTMLLSGVVYLIVTNVVESLKIEDDDMEMPDVEADIRSVCMVMVSRKDNDEEELDNKTS